MVQNAGTGYPMNPVPHLVHQRMAQQRTFFPPQQGILRGPQNLATDSSQQSQVTPAQQGGNMGGRKGTRGNLGDMGGRGPGGNSSGDMVAEEVYKKVQFIFS